VGAGVGVTVVVVLPPPPQAPIVRASRSIQTRESGRRDRLAIPASATAAMPLNASGHRGNFPFSRPALRLVVTVAVISVALLVGVTTAEVGERLHVMPAGAEQLRVTVPLNVVGVLVAPTNNEYVAVWPAATVWLAPPVIAKGATTITGNGAEAMALYVPSPE